METSTPINSPVRKRLPNRTSLIALDEDQIDLANELQTRRLEAINKSTEQRRRSVAPPIIAGLNGAQLAQHCKDCIKLSTENKINSKNAFCFLLIDVMAAMTKKMDSEISKNFQVASCTLDASVKIYGYRVDAVHTEAVKVAGGFMGKEAEEALDDGEQSENDEKATVKLKPKRKKRKTTLATANSLNAKSETESMLDAVPKQNMLSKSSDGSQLLTRVPKYNDHCLLMVEADVSCWPYDCDRGHALPGEQTEETDMDALLSSFGDAAIASEDKLCAAATAIEFGKDAHDDVTSDMELSQASAFEFDQNASVAHVSDHDDFEEPQAPLKLQMPATGYDSGEEICAPKQAQRRQTATITDMKRKLSVQSMEYSMFDEKVFKAWAGPTYWKVRPSRHSLEDNKENEEGSRAVAAVKRTRRGRIKDILGLFDVEETVLAHNLEASDKTVLAKATLNHWKTAVITLGDDYKYSPKELYTLFHLPHCTVEPRGNESLEEVIEEPLNDDVSADDAPAEELEYCSSMVLPDNADLPDRESDAANKSAFDLEAWDADNMVSVPNKVKKIAVNAFHRKKHIDIKHLKKCLWNVIHSDGCVENSKSPISFCKLLTVCPSKLPRTISEGINAPLMFNALLHLTNEKSLVLKQEEKGSDFMITE